MRNQEGKIDRIERLIGLEGTLDSAQRQKLLEIANKCPCTGPCVRKS